VAHPVYFTIYYPWPGLGGSNGDGAKRGMVTIPARHEHVLLAKLLAIWAFPEHRKCRKFGAGILGIKLCRNQAARRRLRTFIVHIVVRIGFIRVHHEFSYIRLKTHSEIHLKPV
jgi:hypothetical protein